MDIIKKAALFLGVAILSFSLMTSPQKVAADGCMPESEPSITITSPNGGEAYVAGQDFTVTWTSCNFTGDENGNVFISLSYPEAWNPISIPTGIAERPNAGSATITMPSTGAFTTGGYQYGTFFKVQISNALGVGEGTVSDLSDADFTINEYVAPTIQTTPADQITQTEARLTGNIAALGTDSSIQVAFEYGSDENYGTITSTGVIMSAPAIFGFTIGNAPSPLACNTTYHYRAIAITVLGNVYGDDMTFTTLACDPLTVVTNAPVSVGATSAVLSGSIISGPTIYSIGFYVSAESGNYGSAVGAPGIYGIGTYSLGTVKVLSCNTQYFYKFVASNNEGGSSVGDEMTFTTLPCMVELPSTETLPATSISTHSVTLNGLFTNSNEGAVNIGYFEYGLTSDYGTTTSFSLEIPHSEGATFSSITGYALLCGTTYHYKAFVTVTIPQAGLPDLIFTVSGSDATFETAPCPMITTYGAADITKTTATLRAVLESTDGESYQAGFEYGTTLSYGSTTPVSYITNVGPFTQPISGLLCGTLYHFKPQISFTEIGEPYVTNISTVFGQDRTFLTSPCNESAGTLPWIVRSDSGAHEWMGVASDTTGEKLVAVSGSGAIITSTDGGITWTPRTIEGTHSWYDVASSTDGTHLAVVDFCGYTVCLGSIYTSTDSGATWTEQTGAGAHNWVAIASSSDGTKLAAIDFDAVLPFGNIYTSTDSGTTWTKQDAAGSRQWTDIAMSADGTRLVATVQAGGIGGRIAVSLDGGTTWDLPDVPGTHNWVSVASNADGTQFALASDGEYLYTLEINEAGVPTLVQHVNAEPNDWNNIASNASGTFLIASASASQLTEDRDYLYVSNDRGVTWSAQTTAPQTSWYAVASDASGERLAAVDLNLGYVWAKITTPTVVTNPVTEITKHGAVINGTLTSFGGSDHNATVEFQTSLDGSIWTVAPWLSYNKTELGAFSFDLNAVGTLFCGTLYHARVSAQNIIGYGFDLNVPFGITFTTLDCVNPSVETFAATSITQTSAILHGNIISLGDESGVLPQFQWGLTTEYTNGLPEIPTTTSEIGLFDQTLTGLTCGTTYHYRLRAPGQSLYAYGNDISFTTSPCTTTGGGGGGGGSGGGGGGNTCTLGKVDANNDCRVDVLDFVILMAKWGQTGANNIGDFNSDSSVDILDFVMLMAKWTK